MTTHPFLSEAWIEQARSIYEAHGPEARAASGDAVTMNLVVEEVPFPPGRLEAHLDTSSGYVEIDLGHLASPSARVTLDYETARAILVEGDSQAAMAAFMAGRIRVEGDLAALLGAFSAPPSTGAGSVAEALRAITEDASGDGRP